MPTRAFDPGTISQTMENVHVRRTTLAVAMILLLAACARGDGESIVLSQSQVDAITANAVNNNGWTAVDPASWSSLAFDACTLRGWDHEVNATLAKDFLRVGGWTDREGADQIPLIIWLNLHIACPELVPDGATPPPGSVGG